MIALAAGKNLKIHQMDVPTAFLNGLFKEEIYMRQPPGVAEKGNEHLVCRLKKSIYIWPKTVVQLLELLALDEHLKTMGFVQSHADPCIYLLEKKGDLVIVGVHVDDMLIAAKDVCII